jgi:CDP-diacylglycerol--serine O-phosphatidyltransferase
MATAKPKKLPLHKMIPNMITLTAMAAGMTGINFAIAGKWEKAVLAIVVAAFMDAFDGAAARLLKAQSKLGAELDSFSDFLCFGVAPAIIVFLWSLHDWARWGWPVALIFAMAVALRLSRFNIIAEDRDPNDPLGKYFTGVPSPTGAGLCLLPMIVSFQMDAADAHLVSHPKVVALWTLVVAAMMVSNIPTFSSKQIRVPYKWKFPVLALFGVFIVGLINETWVTLTLMGVVYLFLLPLGLRHYNRKAAALAQGIKDPDDHDHEE